MVDFDADAAERQAGWVHFTKLMTWGTVVCVVTLVFLALITL